MVHQQHKALEEGMADSCVAVAAATAQDGVDGSKSGGGGDGSTKQQQDAVDSALRKVGRRLVPLCITVAVMNHLDRSKCALFAGDCLHLGQLRLARSGLGCAVGRGVGAGIPAAAP
jgi:hypothetical protein